MQTENLEVLISNIDKIHTTELVSSSDCEIRKAGKNWYCKKGDVELTVNSYNYCVITAKKSSRKN